MARAFYEIFHLLRHARLTLLYQQWHEQFSYLPVSFRLQVLLQCKRKHKSPICQSHCTDSLKSFSSKCHAGTWIAQPVCVDLKLTFKRNRWHPWFTSGNCFKTLSFFPGIIVQKEEKSLGWWSLLPWEHDKKVSIIWILDIDFYSHFLHVERLHNNCISVFGAHLPLKGKFHLLLSSCREVYKSVSTQTWEHGTSLPFQEPLMAPTITASALFRNTGREERSYDKFSFLLKLITSYKGFW